MIIWYSIIAVTLIYRALFGFFGYMFDNLRTVTEVSYTVISVLLLIYGLANISGNVIAGKQLATNPIRSMTFIPVSYTHLTRLRKRLMVMKSGCS